MVGILYTAQQRMILFIIPSNQLEPNELEHLKDFVRVSKVEEFTVFSPYIMQVSLTYCELLVDSQCKATVGKKKGTDKTSQHPAR